MARCNKNQFIPRQSVVSPTPKIPFVRTCSFIAETFCSTHVSSVISVPAPPDKPKRPTDCVHVPREVPQQIVRCRLHLRHERGLRFRARSAPALGRRLHHAAHRRPVRPAPVLQHVPMHRGAQFSAVYTPVFPNAPKLTRTCRTGDVVCFDYNREVHYIEEHARAKEEKARPAPADGGDGYRIVLKVGETILVLGLIARIN